MEIGFITYYNDGVADFAAQAGFDGLELFIKRGASLDMDTLDAAGARGVREAMNRRGLKVMSISCGVNHLDGDTKTRRLNQEYFVKAIRIAAEFGTNIVTTNSWADASRSPADNMAVFQESFSLYAEAAEKEGVQIAIENCPHYNAYPYTIGSIAYSPEIWRAMFEAVPSKAIGLEFDPSHLYWLGIDIPRAIREFGERIYAFHAKDCEIDKDALYRYGILGRQLGEAAEKDAAWWRYRVPGLGHICWKEAFKALLDIGYTGPVSIEHEDPVFCGGPSERGLSLDEKTKRGLSYGLGFLRDFPL